MIAFSGQNIPASSALLSKTFVLEKAIVYKNEYKALVEHFKLHPDMFSEWKEPGPVSLDRVVGNSPEESRLIFTTWISQLCKLINESTRNAILPIELLSDYPAVTKVIQKIQTLVEKKPQLIQGELSPDWRRLVTSIVKNAKSHEVAETLEKEIPLSSPLPGLKNFGNTCYLNAIFKSLATTQLKSVFYPHYERPSDPISVSSKNDIDQLLEMLNSEEQGSALVELPLTSAVNSLGLLLTQELSSFQGSEIDWKQKQQDAPEVLQFILDKFIDKNDTHFKVEVGTFVKNELQGEKPVITLLDEQTLNTYTRNKEILLSVPMYSGFSNLSLMINKSYEEIHPGSKVENGKLIAYQKSDRLVQAPTDTLMIHLKRFEFNRKNNSARKLTLPVDLLSPLFLDEYQMQRGTGKLFQVREPFTSDMDESKRRLWEKEPLQWFQKSNQIEFKLRGVIYHLGQNPNAGHYLYASFESNRDVVIYDDAEVKRIPRVEDEQFPELQTIRENAYLFFYERVPKSAVEPVE